MMKIEIDWWKLSALAKSNPEHYATLKVVQPTLPPIEEVLAGKGYAAFEAYVNDPAEMPDFMFDLVTFKPVRCMKLMIDGRIDSLVLKEAFATAQVHLPGNELLRIHEIQVKEDCCTDIIQTALKDGWRIIAVCPQPSRRPDYILGRL